MYSIIRTRTLRALRVNRTELAAARERTRHAEAAQVAAVDSLANAENQCENLLTELAQDHVSHIKAEREWTAQVEELNETIHKLTTELEAARRVDLDATRRELGPTRIADLTARYGEIVSVIHTLAGAPVIVHLMWFLTRFDDRGAPHLVDKPHHVHGYQWRCLGCLGHGLEGDWYSDAGFRDLQCALEDAAQHVRVCAW